MLSGHTHRPWAPVSITSQTKPFRRNEIVGAMASVTTAHRPRSAPLHSGRHVGFKVADRPQSIKLELPRETRSHRWIPTDKPTNLCLEGTRQRSSSVRYSLFRWQDSTSLGYGMSCCMLTRRKAACPSLPRSIRTAGLRPAWKTSPRLSNGPSKILVVPRPTCGDFTMGPGWLGEEKQKMRSAYSPLPGSASLHHC